MGFMFLSLVSLMIRLAHLQLVKGEAYSELSAANRVRLVRHPPERGRILDSVGRVLAHNAPSFSVSIVPAELTNPRELIECCWNVLGIPQEKMRTLIEASRTIPRYAHYPLKKNITAEQAALISTAIAGIPGVSVEARPVRQYPYQETLCHVIGTLGEISPEELAHHDDFPYRSGDLIGKSGIEREYERYLRGQEGWEQIQIDAQGRKRAKLWRTPPIAGADVILTVDAELQQFTEKIFTQRAGSIVAVDPDSGRILVMVSKPGFDLNLFSPSVSERHWKALTSDASHPLENRALRGLYPPGSTFKIVTASAGLASGLVASRYVLCKGEMELGGQVFRCWNRYGHGKVNLYRALVESCDVYFYDLGLRLGPHRIAQWASLYGFGKPTGLGLPNELPGLVPSPSWKARTLGSLWKDGETVNFSIGQGYVAATPLQMALMTAAVANGGKLLKPTLVKEIRAADGEVIMRHVPEIRGSIPLASEHMEELKRALRAVVEDGRGTGKRARIPGLTIGAKTGTSQVIRERQIGKETQQIPYHERTHAIFVAYVDDRPKKIAVAVVVEHGGGGGSDRSSSCKKTYQSILWRI